MAPDERPDKRIVVGPGDDAGIYELQPGFDIVQTVDVITPVVNDPFTFGAISAVNSLSDVYAMGGTPLTAMAVLGFSSCEELTIVKEIMRGAVDALSKAGTALLGGHSFEDDEIKFGLSVTGFIGRVLITRLSRAADVIILTKPIGTGILATALKGRKISEADMSGAINSMLTLNDRASRAALRAGAQAMTDVTGFGLLGHAYNMVKNTPYDMEIKTSVVPVFDRVRDLIAQGLVPEGAYNNLKFLEGKLLHDGGGIPEEELLLLSDPQTSGGLLIAVDEPSVAGFRKAGVDFSVIGKIIEGSGKIRLL